MVLRMGYKSLHKDKRTPLEGLVMETSGNPFHNLIQDGQPKEKEPMEIRKAEHTEDLSFGSSAISLKDPPLSALSSRRVWLYREMLY